MTVSAVNAQSSPDGTKEQVSNAGKAVGETAGSAVRAVGTAAGIVSGAGLTFGLGGFDSQLVILFQDRVKFAAFLSQGLDASAQAGTMTGNKKDELALQFNEGRAVFVLTKEAWKIAAKLTGSRYWPDDELNWPS